jgi:hypothetical protein
MKSSEIAAVQTTYRGSENYLAMDQGVGKPQIRGSTPFHALPVFFILTHCDRHAGRMIASLAKSHPLKRLLWAVSSATTTTP